MAQYIGHEECFNVLDRMLRAYETGGYTRLVTYGPGESCLFDSNPAPGYVPGVRGKAETGVEYTPRVDGTRVHLYYVAGHKADARAKAEAARAIRSGFDSHEIMGTLVSIRRMKEGGIQLQFVAGNRDNIEGGAITDKLAIRSVSITRVPAAKGGTIVAMGIDQSLGIPYHMLKSLAEAEKVQGGGITALSDGLRAIRSGETSSGIPEVKARAEGQGLTGPGVEEAV